MIPADRELVEEQAGICQLLSLSFSLVVDEILKDADTGDVAFLVVGDPLG